MHSIIGNKIAETLSIEDKASFLFGSVAADAVFSVEDKNASHFFIGDAEKFTRRVDFESFFQKYHKKAEEYQDYLLGYYTHLIADDIWLRGFYQSWLRNRMNQDEGYYKRYHQDFRLFNGKLLEYYGCSDELLKIFKQVPNMTDLDEVKVKEVEDFIPYVIRDMDYSNEVIKEPLKVFTMDQIVGYIETSVEVGITYIKQVNDRLSI